MFAKLKEGYRWPSITSCGGVVFNKQHFVMVPAGREEEARKNSHLILVDELPESEKPIPEPIQAQPAPAQVQNYDTGLSSRIWTVLNSVGLPDEEAVRGYVEAKGIDGLKAIEGIGKKSLQEIINFLELED